MLKQARDYLTDNGVFVLEVGNSYPALQAAYRLGDAAAPAALVHERIGA